MNLKISITFLLALAVTNAAVLPSTTEKQKASSQPAEAKEDVSIPPATEAQPPSTRISVDSNSATISPSNVAVSSPESSTPGEPSATVAGAALEVQKNDEDKANTKPVSPSVTSEEVKEKMKEDIINKKDSKLGKKPLPLKDGELISFLHVPHIGVPDYFGSEDFPGDLDEHSHEEGDWLDHHYVEF